MTPEDMAEKIVRYEWQGIAELASLLGTWRNEIVAATREERSEVMRKGRFIDVDEWRNLPEIRDASIRVAMEWAEKPPKYDCKEYPRSLEFHLGVLAGALINSRKQCADRMCRSCFGEDRGRCQASHAKPGGCPYWCAIMGERNEV